MESTEDQMEAVIRSFLSGERSWPRFISRVEIGGGIPLALKVLEERGTRLCAETVILSLRQRLQSRHLTGF